jgi:hypothetical protein
VGKERKKRKKEGKKEKKIGKKNVLTCADTDTLRTSITKQKHLNTDKKSFTAAAPRF